MPLPLSPGLGGICAALGASAMLALSSCKMPGEQQDISKLTEEFVYGSLALSPVAATQAGYHQHDGTKLDDELDDYSRAGVQDQIQFYNGFRDRLAAIQI